MGWFTKKESFKPISVKILNAAMATDAHGPKELEHCMVNNLEAVIAIFWFVTECCEKMGKKKQELVGEYLFGALLVWFEDSYSPSEIESLVVPAFEKRLAEYSKVASYTQDEDPSKILFRLLKRVMSNVYCENDPSFEQVMAIPDMWMWPISEEVKKLCALDQSGAIDWKA